jgi:hypothetical protein
VISTLLASLNFMFVMEPAFFTRELEGKGSRRHILRPSVDPSPAWNVFYSLLSPKSGSACFQLLTLFLFFPDLLFLACFLEDFLDDFFLFLEVFFALAVFFTGGEAGGSSAKTVKDTDRANKRLTIQAVSFFNGFHLP